MHATCIMVFIRACYGDKTFIIFEVLEIYSLILKDLGEVCIIKKHWKTHYA